MVTFAEDLSYSDPVAQSFKSSKSSSLNQSQGDSDDVPNKCREHLLVVSSFLFALIWGFGAHLPSRYLQRWGMGNAEGRDGLAYGSQTQVMSWVGGVCHKWKFCNCLTCLPVCPLEQVLATL